MAGYYKDLIEQTLQRTREATLSILGIGDPPLREHLASSIRDEMGHPDCFLAPPVFEHTFGWKAGKQQFADLEGSLLSSDVLTALTQCDNADFRFPPDAKPYTHQLQAWETLLDEKPKSVVVTTGTGSGKTECFMVPILQDLIAEHKRKEEPLVGVRALFLYPLNALINSQRERLDAWTLPFSESVRFCLYNGNTEESESSVRKEQRRSPNQILSRERLRKEPAPILLTNATMLEYMLVRQNDEPILKISREQQSLRWIVLDEAHTYMGSQAAELSMLLRRVVEAFGRQAKDIRFVATSATIADKRATERLRSYLASLAGVPDDQVVVVGGSRQIPTLEASQESNEQTLEALTAIDAGSGVSRPRYQALCASRAARLLRDKVVNAHTPVELNALVETATPYLRTDTTSARQREVLDWVDLMTDTRPEAGASSFLQLRCHLFQRMLHGLWACVDPSCSAKPASLDHWPFGKPYVSNRSRCECSAPVYELGFCSECREPHLQAMDANGVLMQRETFSGDEFSLQDDYQDDAPDESAALGHALHGEVVLAARPDEQYQDITLDLGSRELSNVQGDELIRIYSSMQGAIHCSNCGFSGHADGSFLRNAYLGAPFYVSHAVPTVLEFCPDPDGKTLSQSPESLPGRGRKLITFTDSRQGTARMAVRMQQEAERSRLRGLVFESLRNHQARANSSQSNEISDPEEIRASIRLLERHGQEGMANELREKLKLAECRPPERIPFARMMQELSASDDIKESILDYNRYANPELFGGDDGSMSMARLLLLREYARRPKNNNSTETLGLVAVDYQGLNNIRTVPQFWKETQVPAINNSSAVEPLTEQDWGDFLKVSLDYFVRENTFFVLDNMERNWMGARFSPKQLYPPGADVRGHRDKAWPQIGQGGGNRHRLIKLLCLGTGLQSSAPGDRDKINHWLAEAWRALINAQILQAREGGYTLARDSMMFYLPEQAWVCPITHRLLDTAFRGLTPYLPPKPSLAVHRCERVDLPDYTSLAPRGEMASTIVEVRKRVEENAQVDELRRGNLWTDISDRVVEGGFYYRTAEHSAQQSSDRLQEYEGKFKKGKINVLNCSTTMEMGVDIGGMSAVVMNNLPPHPANYLQRAGRAGRRQEARSISYTLCKPNPHNKNAFRNPLWPFVTAIPAPVISLSANPLIQRHVNAFLLSCFLKEEAVTDDQRTRLTVQWFFGGEESRSDQFQLWLSDAWTGREGALKRLVSRTVLENTALSHLCGVCQSAIGELATRWKEEAARIEQRLESTSDEAYLKALEFEQKRHYGEYLLRDLSARTFLPGHGFPTDVVNLNIYNIEDFKHGRRASDASREDNIFQFKEQPTRSLPVAIREYAPGAQVVVDGRVYRSAGVSLYSSLESEHGAAQKFDVHWRCPHCGTDGYREYTYLHDTNPQCGNPDCGHSISANSLERVLRPVGFVTDFYESTSNDVTTQKYIPVEEPRVIVTGPLVGLPDERCGFLRYSEDGVVYHHTRGENGKGYAICMACGRSDSMSANGELPGDLSPGGYHRPVGGGTMRGGKAKDCSNEKVLSGLFLGCRARTNALEVILRSPVTGEWIPNSDKGRIVAYTLALALRDTFAASQGIGTDEIGFRVRPGRDLDTGASRTVIQMYDQATGGAGFVMAGIESIAQHLARAAERLSCLSDCEKFCHVCLGSSDRSIDPEKVDRKLALDWLKQQSFERFLELPQPFDQIPGAQYWPYTGMRFVEHNLQRGANAISLSLSGKTDQWDLSDPGFRNRVLGWQLNRGVEVTFIVPSEVIQSEEILEELRLYNRLGVGVGVKEAADRTEGFVMPVQIRREGGALETLISDPAGECVPGAGWLSDRKSGTWVISRELPLFQYREIEIPAEKQSANAHVIEITNQLNGPVKTLDTRFRALLEECAGPIMEKIGKEPVISIHYEDRYLRSPWAVLLLGSLIQHFKSDALRDVSVETSLPERSDRASMAWDNWPDRDELRRITAAWLEAMTGVVPEIAVNDSIRALSHRRVLTLRLESGLSLKCVFDQGMGYWGMSTPDYRLRQFDFLGTTEEQASAMVERWKSVSLTNTADWPTHIALYVD